MLRFAASALAQHDQRAGHRDGLDDQRDGDRDDRLHPAGANDGATSQVVTVMLELPNRRRALRGQRDRQARTEQPGRGISPHGHVLLRRGRSEKRRRHLAVERGFGDGARANAAEADLRLHQPGQRRVRQVARRRLPERVTLELHRSTVSGFTPGSNTLVSDEIVSENWNGKVYATGLTVQFGRETRVRTTARCNWARLTYYVMRGVDAGVAGPYSDEQAVTPQAS